MLSWFEKWIDPYKDPDGAIEPVRPPDRLIAFYWHYLRQVLPIFLITLITGFFAVITEVAMFTFIGQIVDLLRAAGDAATFFSNNSVVLAWMAFVVLVARPILFGIHSLLVDLTINPGFTGMVIWQIHRYVVRQSLSFFLNDMAGKITNKVTSTALSVRSSVVEALEGVWSGFVYAASTLVVFVQLDARLAIPLIVWAFAFALIATQFIPRIKTKSGDLLASRSTLFGRIVDAYTNIMTLKLFAHGKLEDKQSKEAMDDALQNFRGLSRWVAGLEIVVTSLNGLLIVSTCGLSIWLWSTGTLTIGAVVVATALVIRINDMAEWIMWVITGIAENVGTVMEGMTTVARPYSVVDHMGAGELDISAGEIRFENVDFSYGSDTKVLDNLSLVVRPGEKIGLIGKSGAGKSTFVNALLRFYDLEGGRIMIDGQSVADVRQVSLRTQVGVALQDSSMLNRSVMENILYGDPGASEEAVKKAAKLALAHDFILNLEDHKKRQGYDAHVGERGLTLSGGQRQRIAIARVILKNAPIVILDEATSAIDSETESAIQKNLNTVFSDKTVITIAHRLSTLAGMDRLLVLDEGRIVEDGSHKDLIAVKNGVYANLWAHYSAEFDA